jgi:hypothetical protein
MTMWFRVFGTSETEPAPSALLEHMHGLGLPITGNFVGDDEGWFRAELADADGPMALSLERFLASEEGIRAELNNWAAWIETTGEDAIQTRLMQHMIATRQLFTLRGQSGDMDLRDQVCLAVCGFLGRETAGVYQVDQRGFFDADGTLLLKE